MRVMYCFRSQSGTSERSSARPAGSASDDTAWAGTSAVSRMVGFDGDDGGDGGDGGGENEIADLAGIGAVGRTA